MEVGQFGNLRIGAIIQARFDSSRFFGKVLKSLPFGSNETILSQIHHRLSKVKLINEIIIATSTEDSDDSIYDYCVENNFICERGRKQNVLDRFVMVSQKRKLDVVIRITGDNPIVFVDLLENAIKEHIDKGVDYTRSLNLPYGTGFEIVNSDVLRKINLKKLSASDCEHVTIYIKDNRDKFLIQEIQHGLPKLDFRFTIDYPSDYAVMSILFQFLAGNDYEYNFVDLKRFIDNNLWLHEINCNNFQKKQFKLRGQEIDESIEVLRKLGYTNSVEILSRDR